MDYSYDATINSVTRACESLTQFRPYSKKLILVIGDVSNPGPNPEETHLKLGYYLAALPIDSVITVGNHARGIAEGIRRLNHTRKELYSCETPEQLLKSLPGYCKKGATLQIIGSKTQKLHEVVEHLCASLKD